MKPKVRFVPNRLHLKTGDMAYIISGKDKGKVGKVLKVLPKMGMVVVDDINIKTKHVKPNQKNEKGSIVKAPAPIYSCKAMLYSEKNQAPSRVGKKILKDGSKVRVLTKFGETV